MSIANIFNDEKKLTSQSGCSFDAVKRVETELIQTQELGHKTGGTIEITAPIALTYPANLTTEYLDVNVLGTTNPPAITLASDMYFNEQYTAYGLGGVYCIDNSSSTILATNLSLYPRSDNIVNGIGFHIDVSSATPPYKWGHSGAVRITNSADPFCLNNINMVRKMHYDVPNNVALAVANTYYTLPLGTPLITDDVSYNSTGIIITNPLGRCMATFNVKAELGASLGSTQTFTIALKRTRVGSVTKELDTRSVRLPGSTTKIIDFGSLTLLSGFIQDNPGSPLELAPGDLIEIVIQCTTSPTTTVYNYALTAHFEQLL